MPDDDGKKYDWELYAQLTTHKAIEELREKEIFLRDALSPLRSLFELDRAILRDYDPTIALKKVEDDLSFGNPAIIMPNMVLRATLAKWHSLHLSHDNPRIASVLLLDNEQQMNEHEDLR